MKRSYVRYVTTGVAISAVVAILPHLSYARINQAEITQKTAETQVRHLLEPVLEKYCRDDCKLMSVSVNVEMTSANELAPGFDDVDGKSISLAPASAQAKLMINDKVGSVSRGKLLDLIQQYLETLDYPVKISTQLVHFPEPIEAAGKISEIRERVAKQFKGTIDELFNQACPGQCMLTDFNIQTEAVNTEEAQYGSPGEFVQEGNTAVRIKDISATLLIDDALSPEERTSVLEMAKLKTNYIKHVSLSGKALKFPHPANLGGNMAGGGWGANGLNGNRSLASEQKNNSTSESKTNNASTSNNTNTESKQESKQETRQESKQETKQETHQDTRQESKNETHQDTRQERFERFEKIERVENGDAVQNELKKFKLYGLIFFASIIGLLIFIAVAIFRQKGGFSTVHRVIQSMTADPLGAPQPGAGASAEGGAGGAHAPGSDDRATALAKRYEAEALLEELSRIFANQPKVAKQVFSRILSEDGVEITAQYLHLFGEGILVDLLRDPSLQGDLNELTDYFSKTTIEINDSDKLELLQALRNRTVAGKIFVLGSRSTNLFDFLAEMDGQQILELIRNESLTVKSIVLTQCDAQKRTTVYAHVDEDTRMKLLTELSRIDYLPRDYIANVAHALKRKSRENPKLNTEALPGSEVLLSLLERTGTEMQKTVVRNLESSNPESARAIKGKLVSAETLRYLRDNQLLEVILSLKHDELLQFLKGASESIRRMIFSKSPKDLIAELEEELAALGAVSREAYQAVERKILNRVKMMANEGIINLVETNDRMFQDAGKSTGVIETGPDPATLKKVAGW